MQKQKVDIACISTYPPRQCGIATFTNHLTQAIMNSSESKDTIDASIYIVAANDQEYTYPGEVKYTMNCYRDYLNAAKFINKSNANVCILQHEFGIFDGNDGGYILPLIHWLEIPLIVIVHTVLKDPSYNQKAIVHEMAKKARKMVVMNPIAIDFLSDIYDVPKNKIILIEHGVPDFESGKIDLYKNKLHLSGRKVLLTFGLLSRDKGIETVLEALPKVVSKYPDVLYVILGKTHPNVLKDSGEEYRIYLNRLVNKYHLRKNVEFLDVFVKEERLKEYLYATDIYITPYLNEAQITSGTLSYAVGAGTAVVSTPYWHARELLSDGRGRLFNFNDSSSLANILNELLDNPLELEALRKKAYSYGRHITWPKIGAKYRHLALDLVKLGRQGAKGAGYIFNPDMLPHFMLDHVVRMTDDTGIFQHSKYSIPNRKDGYHLDDNARALLMLSIAYKNKNDQALLSMLSKIASYVHYMQNTDGTFRGFLSFDRRFLDKRGAEDTFGRAVWALGYQIRFPVNDYYFHLAKEMFAKALPNITDLNSLRGIADTMIGLSHYLMRYQEDEAVMNMLKPMADKLLYSYNEIEDGDWGWFEKRLTYDNGILPLSIFHAYQVLGDEKLLRVAEDTCGFLEKVLFENEYLSLVGNAGWYEKGAEKARFDQQPVDAMSVVLMFRQAYRVTGNRHYLERMYTSFMWFLGENDLGIPLYNFETKGCHDGLSSKGVNLNQGSESSITYLISYLTVLDAYEKEK